MKSEAPSEPSFVGTKPTSINQLALKTTETRFEKDLNRGGKRLGDAGLIRKVRTHWELTEEGKRNFFTAQTLTLLCELAGRAKKKAKKGALKRPKEYYQEMVYLVATAWMAQKSAARWGLVRYSYGIQQ